MNAGRDSMDLSQICKMLIEKNQENGFQNAWIDTETNAIWMLGKDEGELYRFYGKDKNLKEMTDEEKKQFVVFLYAMTDEEGITYDRWTGIKAK